MLVERRRFLDLLMSRLRGKIFLVHSYVCGLMFSGQSISNVQRPASFCRNPKLPCVLLIGQHKIMLRSRQMLRDQKRYYTFNRICYLTKDLIQNISGSFLRMWIDVFRTVNIQCTASCIILQKSQATLRAPYRSAQNNVTIKANVTWPETILSFQ